MILKYPFSYGDELTPEMASKNRKQAVSYSVLIPSIWWHNLGFGEPIQSDSSHLNLDHPQMTIIQKVETSRVNSITRGGELGKSGPGPRGKADAIRDAQKMRYIKKMRNGGIFADGFTPQRQYGPRPIDNKALTCRNNVKLIQDQFNNDDGDPNLGGSSSSISMEKLCRRLSLEYLEYQKQYNLPAIPNRFDTKNFDQDKFIELAKDPKRAEADQESFYKTPIDEARTAIQLEIQGIVDNPQRIEKPICKSVDLDFKVDGPAPYTHLDVKHPVGSNILAKQRPTADVETMAYKMGIKIARQKERFCKFEQGPKSSENVLHVVDLRYVPSNETEIIKDYCLRGAETQVVGTSDHIQFINDKTEGE